MPVLPVPVFIMHERATDSNNLFKIDEINGLLQKKLNCLKLNRKVKRTSQSPVHNEQTHVPKICKLDF